MNTGNKNILVINIMILVILLLGVEFSSYKIYQKKVAPLLAHHKKISTKNLQIKYTYPVLFNIDNYEDEFREIKGKNIHKSPVLLLGASYTTGHNLKGKERLDYKLSKSTGRSVYTRAIDGSGPQSIYYILKNTDIKDEIPNAEFIIYPFVPSQIFKPYEYSLSYISTRPNIRYKLENGKLKEIKPLFPVLYSSFTVKMIQNYLRDEETTLLIKNGKQYDLFNVIMDNIIRTTKEDFPNSKFILLEYPDPDFGIPDTHKIEKIPQEEKNYLEKSGYIYVNAEDLIGKDIGALEYRAEDKDHPNGKAWEEIVPKLIRKFKI